jgi:hypothetical protein
MLFDYQHHIVRDLAWAIASPPLLIPDNLTCVWYRDDWYRDLYSSSQSWLQELDAAPEKLQERLDSQKDRRLGRYFETLWAFWLENSQRFEIVEHNLPLRDEKKTLGELDFLVLDKQSGKHLHWEMAVKFYLGAGDTQRQANWHGPGKKDRLDLKVEHLRNKQSVICKNSSVQPLLQKMGYQIDGCGVILKGRLFYPHARLVESAPPMDVNPHHLRSYWITMADLQQNYEGEHHQNKCFSPLVGYGWMASADESQKIPWMSMDELVDALKTETYRLPLYVSCRQKEGANLRIFIVSDGWADDLI